MPEYKVSTLYSGTELGTDSLCAHVFWYFLGTLPTNHFFPYPQLLATLDGAIWSKDEINSLIDVCRRSPWCPLSVSYTNTTLKSKKKKVESNNQANILNTERTHRVIRTL